MTNKLLFLDVETTGLNPFNSQIIEIGGVIVDFDSEKINFKVIDKFQSLVKLRLNFDDKTTRLTGITKEQLLNSKEIEEVKKDWKDWLNKYDCYFIVGHSINFDLSFLESEKWYLPEKYTCINTLEIARILLPDFVAINQEYILEKKQLVKEKIKKHHRALFDALANIKVLKFLIKRLIKLGLDNEINDLITKNYLFLPIIIYPKKDYINNLNINFRLKIAKNIDFEGNIIDNNFLYISQLLKWYDFREKLKDIIILAKENGKIQNTSLLLYVANHIALKGKKVKLHLLNNQKKTLDNVSYIFRFLIQQVPESVKYTETLLPKLESILWLGATLLKEKLQIGAIADNLSLLQEILEVKLTKNPKQNINILENIKKYSIDYDFWLADLQRLIDKQKNSNIYFLDTHSTLPEDLDLNQKTQNLLQKTQEIKLSLLDYKKSQLKLLKNPTALDILELIIINKLLNLLKIEVDKNQNFTFYIKSEQAEITWNKNNFNFKQHFQELHSKFSDLKSFSFLPLEYISFILKIFNLEEYIPDITKEKIEVNLLENIDLEELATSNLEENQKKQTISLFLPMNNAHIRRITRLLTTKYKTKDYLIFGESGSSTKILSKIKNGFSGIVVFNYSNLEYLLKNIETKKISKIYFLGQTYFYLNPDLEKSLLSNLLSIENKREIIKKMFMLSLIYYYYYEYNLTSEIIDSYNITV